MKSNKKNGTRAGPKIDLSGTAEGKCQDISWPFLSTRYFGTLPERSLGTLSSLARCAARFLRTICSLQRNSLAMNGVYDAQEEHRRTTDIN